MNAVSGCLPFTRPRFAAGDPEDANIVTLAVSGTGITRVETEGLVRNCGQAIDGVVFTVTLPDACPPTQGFWKNHEER